MKIDLPDDLIDRILGFKHDYCSHQWQRPSHAFGKCWEASSCLLEHLKSFENRGIEALCFSKKETSCYVESYTGIKHNHKVKVFFPFKLTEDPHYDLDHRYTFVILKDGRRVNIDFTARQFNPSLPYPLVWIQGEKDPIHV